MSDNDHDHPMRLLLVGASSEIGHALAVALLGDAPGVAVLAGRPSDRRAAVAADLAARGHTTHELEYEASGDEQAARAVIRRTKDIVGGLDVVVVAVGAMPGAPEVATPVTPGTIGIEPDLARVLTVNLLGPALVADAAAATLAEQGRGTLVVVTSAAAVHPRGDILGYAAAKQALDTLVRGLDRKVRARGVRCLVVRPGRVRTRMTDGLPPVPMTTGPGHVAARVRAAVAASRPVVWSPAALGPMTILVSVLPRRLLPRGLR